jgi:hypothetical protein
MTVVSIDLPRSPDSVTAARRLVDAHATGLDAQQRQDAALMVSELVANAVLHPALTAAGVCGSSTSSPPTGEFSRQHQGLVPAWSSKRRALTLRVGETSTGALGAPRR